MTNTLPHQQPTNAEHAADAAGTHPVVQETREASRKGIINHVGEFFEGGAKMGADVVHHTGRVWRQVVRALGSVSGAVAGTYHDFKGGYDKVRK